MSASLSSVATPATPFLNPFAAATRRLMICGIAMSFALSILSPAVVIFVAAIMLGFSEVNGLCGVSHIGSLTPLRAFGRRTWIKAVSAYTLGGVATASFVGACLGLLGGVLGVSLGITVYLIVPLAVILAARELGWIHFPLPQFRKQTHKWWAVQYGFTTGAAMWGAHIGFAFLTVIKHGGLFVLTVAAISLSPLAASALVVAYWLGRTAPIWLVPVITTERAQRYGGKMGELVFASERALRHLATAGLLCAGAAMVLAALDA